MGTPETSRNRARPYHRRRRRSLRDGRRRRRAFHFLKGIYNSPKGARLIGGSQAVRMNAPRVGGSFAVWGGLFSTFDCTMVYNAPEGGPLELHHWPARPPAASSRCARASARRLIAAAMGGILLALIEGAGIMLNKFNDSEGSSGSWFGGWFGKGKEPEAAGSGSETKVLESFDAPAVPTFEYK
ncbi:hypothetical protein M0R45_020212 [Rubus argutus]|uniref:Uncharacterized protein n=1 Tax=Rubus argutus TaxID=59490 RepID=A0AAW1X8N2_RUBAR